jgi:hypothetical protein
MKREFAVAALLLAAVLVANSWLPNPWAPKDFPVDSEAASRRNLTPSTTIQAASELQLASFPSFAEPKGLANEILLHAISELRQSPPLKSELAVNINLLEEEFELTGTYWQAGEGAPHSRLDLKVPESDPRLEITQIFDGRFYYVLETNGNQKRLTYIDQMAVSNLGTPRVNAVAGLRGWFGTGSWPVLLEQLASSFDFEVKSEVDFETDQGSPGKNVTLTGKWRRESLHQLLRDQIRAEWIGEEIQWDRLPQQIPHEIEITLASVSGLPTYPQQIVFYQHRRSRKKAPQVRTPIFSVTNNTLEINLHNDPAIYRVAAEGILNHDLTEEYLNRVKVFLYQPVSR